MSLGIVGVLVGLMAEGGGCVVVLKRFGSGEVGSEGGECVLVGGGGDVGGGSGGVVAIAWFGVGLVVGRGGRVVGCLGK